MLSGLGVLFVALVGHEVGHLAAGRLCGYRFGLLGVGPICISRVDERLRLRWLPPSHWGPFAMAYPVTSTVSTSRAAWYAAGGPLASGIIAVAAASGMVATSAGVVHRVAALLALLSACLFVATAQPFGTGVGIPSDGARVWRLLRDTGAAKSLAALLALDGCETAGVRPRDWPPEVVQLAAGVDTPPAYSLAAATASLRWALDRGDIDAARGHMHRLRSVYVDAPRWLRGDAAAEAAIWFACFETDLPAARTYLSDVRGLFALPYRRCTAEAAVALASGDVDGAHRAIGRSTAALRQGMAVVSDFDVERLEAMRVRLHESHAVSPIRGSDAEDR